MFSFVVTLSEKSGLTIFQNFLLSLTSFYKVAIMRFFGIWHNGYIAHSAQRLRCSSGTTVTFLILCSFIFFRSKTKKLFLNLDLVIISLLSSFVIKGAWFALTYFFSGGACQSSDFLHASRKPIRSSFGMLLLDNSWLNLHERVHLKNSSNFDS